MNISITLIDYLKLKPGVSVDCDLCLLLRCILGQRREKLDVRAFDS